MTFSIPKHLSGINSLATPTVIDVELNDTDVDRMLTKVLEMAVKRGRGSSSRVDTYDYAGFLEKLRSSEHLKGFGSDRGLEVLDGWVRASVLKEEKAGRKRDRVQMGYIRPLTVAAYRSGLPKTTSRNRRADSLIYRSMELSLQKAGSTNPSAEIQSLFLATFGRGVELGPFPSTYPCYDNTHVDIDTLLALRFIEGFDGNERLSKEARPLDPPVPTAAEPIGEDLLTFLRLYGPTMNVSEAFTHVSAIMSLRLFQLPLVTAHVVRSTLKDGEFDTSIGNPTEIYCDFGGELGSPSDELSRAAVVRDLEVLRTFFSDRLLLRTLNDAVEVLPDRADLGETAEHRLASLAKLKDKPEMQMALRMQINSIYTAMEDSTEGREFIDQVRSVSVLSAADQIAAILVEGLRKRGLENQVKWFHSTGGISKSYGILSGSVRARSTWRYTISDEVLTTLLCMCFVDENGERTSRRLKIAEILDRLQRRFGILVAHPPSHLDSADARSAAATNLESFTRRLKMLGCFQGLSDDFDAQFVTRPRGAVK